MNPAPPPVPAVPGAQSKTSGLAITSLVLGILAVLLTIVCVGPLLAIPAIICGHIASARINRSGGQLAGKGLAIAGFATGYASLALILLLLPIAIPNFVKARETAQNNRCIGNLRQIEGAKQQWALENSKDESAIPTASDLDKYFERGLSSRKCPKGGTYTLGPVRETPACTIPEHSLK